MKFFEFTRHKEMQGTNPYLTLQAVTPKALATNKQEDRLLFRRSIVCILLLLLASSAESELTPKDLAAIESIVQKETAKTEKYTDLKFKNAETEFRTRFDGLDKQLVAGFSNVDKRLDDFRAWTIGVIVIPSTVLFFVGLWIVKAIKQLSWTEAPHHRITNAPRTPRTYSTAGYDGDFR